MRIETIKLENYRNYESLELELDPGTNLFYGDNAQGKTNILESVYLCGTTKSHRGSKDREMIRFGQEEAHIRMETVRKEIPCRVEGQGHCRQWGSHSQGQRAHWSWKFCIFFT